MNIDTLDILRTPFKFDGEEYVLQEPSEPAVVRYRAEQFRGVKVSDAGDVEADLDRERVQQVFEAQMNLVGACVYRVADGKQAADPIGEEIRRWPHRHVKSRFEWVHENCMLEDSKPEALERQIARLQERLAVLRNGTFHEDAVKNSSGATAGTSA